MDRGQDLNWRPNKLSLEQVQAVISYHREININFVLGVLKLCSKKKKRAPKTASAVLPKVRHKIGG